jgi:hypothetical protein
MDVNSKNELRERRLKNVTDIKCSVTINDGHGHNSKGNFVFRERHAQVLIVIPAMRSCRDDVFIRIGIFLSKRLSNYLEYIHDSLNDRPTNSLN